MNTDMFIWQHCTNGKPLILIVDDVPENLQVLGMHLDNAGYDTAFATDGFEALAILEDLSPDLILLDVSMPNIDGFEVCRRIKLHEKTSKMPIIFLTAHMEKERVLEGLSLGAVDFITKPFHAQELLLRVKTHVSLYCAMKLLEEQNIQLTNLNQEITDMISIASHDLKNPLQSMVLAIDLISSLMQRQRYDDIAVQTVKLKNVVAQMIQIVENWLNLHVLESKHSSLKSEQVNIVQVLEYITEQYQVKADNKHINLHFLNRIQTHPFIDGKRLYIEEVFDNLLSNAVKFTPYHGKIEVYLSETKSAYRVQVSDNGMGMSDEDKAMLFTKFAKLSNRPTGGESSTGLGLAIVKRLVDALNAKVWCESSLGIGTSFFVEFEKI